MFCPSCGKENANAFGYCNACGKPLAPVGGVAPTPAPGPAPTMYQGPVPGGMPPTNAPKSGNPVAIVVIVLILVGGLGTFAYLRSRDHQGSGSRFLNQSTDNETPETRIGRLVREAAGQQPVKEASSAQDREFDDAFREQYRNLFRINQEYLAAVKNTDITAASKLGSPESFADPDSFAEGLKQLHTVYDLDMSQEQKVAEVVANIRRIIETGSWSAGDREGAMRGFDAGIAEPLAKRQTAVSAEQAWVQSIDDVYDYARSNHSAFVLNGGQVTITDNGVLEEFNSKVRTMNSRRTDFLQAKQNYDQYQQQLFKKMGVAPKDVGLQ